MDRSAASLSSSPASVKQPHSSLNPQSSLNSAEVYNADNQTDSKGSRKGVKSSPAAREGEVANGPDDNEVASLGDTDLESLDGEESHGQGSTSNFLDGEEIEDEGAFSAKFELDELKLIEEALEKLNKKSETEPQLKRGEDDEGKASENSETARQDLEDVGKLLKKIQAVKLGRKESRSRDNRSVARGGEELESANIRQAVRTASEVAFTAAEAVEKIARRVKKNYIAIERLTKAMESSTSQELHKDTLADLKKIEDGSPRANDTPLEEQLEEHIDIAKNVIKQNRITHWVLGFMIVTSCIWRFKVYRAGKQVDKVLKNPFDSFTGMFNNDNEEGFKFPFQDSEAEIKRKKKLPDSEKERDTGPFSIGNMWSNGEQNKKK